MMLKIAMVVIMEMIGMMMMKRKKTRKENMNINKKNKNILKELSILVRGIQMWTP
jgi:hypothetical protein